METVPVFEPVELSGEWPPGAPSGIFSCHPDGDSLVIDHADPRLMISAELVERAAGRSHACVSVAGRLDYTRPGGHVGALLKIRGVNRNVVYRLAGWYPSIRAYLGEFV